MQMLFGNENFKSLVYATNALPNISEYIVRNCVEFTYYISIYPFSLPLPFNHIT